MDRGCNSSHFKSYTEMIEINMTPFPKPRLTHGDRIPGRKVADTYYRKSNELWVLCKNAKYIPTETLSITFVIPIPKSYSKKVKLKKGILPGQPHKQRPDLDNLIKAFKDSLYKEDSIVWKYCEMKKIWGLEGKILIYEGENEK